MPSMLDNIETINQKKKKEDLEKKTIFVKKKRTLKALVSKGAIKMKKAEELFPGDKYGKKRGGSGDQKRIRLQPVEGNILHKP